MVGTLAIKLASSVVKTGRILSSKQELLFWTLETPLTRVSFSLLLTINQLVPSVFQILKDARNRRHSNALLKSIVEVETKEFEKKIL